MAPPATAIVGPQPKEKKKKKLRRRGVKREQVLDVGGLMCVLLGMALCWAYMSYHFPDSAPRLLPKDGWCAPARPTADRARAPLRPRRTTPTLTPCPPRS